MYTQSITNNKSSEDAAAIESKKRRIQMEIMIAESNMRKMFEEKNMLDMYIKKLTRDAERIRVELDGNKNKLGRVLQNISSTEDELRTLRKRLNLL